MIETIGWGGVPAVAAYLEHWPDSEEEEDLEEAVGGEGFAHPLVKDRRKQHTR